MNFDDKLICDVMGRKSPERSYEDLVADYVCGNENVYDSKFKQLFYLLPKPFLHINRSIEILQNGQEYIRLSCLNIKEICAREINGTKTEINIRLVHHKLGYVVVAYFPLTKLIEWRVYHSNVSYILKYNATNTEPSFDVPVLFVDNPVTDFNGHLPIEILIRKSVLENYEEGWCEYRNQSYTSEKQNLSNFRATCTKDDYAITSYKIINDGMFFVCEMDYDSAVRKKCNISNLGLILRLSIHGQNETSDVRCLGNSETDHKSGELPFEFNFSSNSSQRGYCVYNDKIMKNSAIVVLDDINKSDWRFACLLKRGNEDNQLLKLGDDVENNVSCVVPPAIFKPAIKVVNENQSAASTVLTCSLPDWEREPCYYNSTLRRKDVLLYTETSSNLKKTNREAIAILRVDGTCNSHPDHTCKTRKTSTFHDARVLMEVVLDDSVFYDIAGEPGAVLKVGCAMEDVRLERKEIVLTGGLLRVMAARKTNFFNETSLEKPTLILLEERHVFMEKIYLVVITLSLTIIVLLVVVVVTVLNR